MVLFDDKIVGEMDYAQYCDFAYIFRNCYFLRAQRSRNIVVYKKHINQLNAFLQR